MIESLSLLTMLAGPAMPLAQLEKVLDTVPVTASGVGQKTGSYTEARAAMLGLVRIADEFLAGIDGALGQIIEVYEDLDLFEDMLSEEPKLKNVMLMVQSMGVALIPRLVDSTAKLDAFDQWAINHSQSSIDTEALQASKKVRQYTQSTIRFFREFSNLLNQVDCTSVEGEHEFLAEQQINQLIDSSSSYLASRA